MICCPVCHILPAEYENCSCTRFKNLVDSFVFFDRPVLGGIYRFDSNGLIFRPAEEQLTYVLAGSSKEEPVDPKDVEGLVARFVRRVIVDSVMNE